MNKKVEMKNIKILLIVDEAIILRGAKYSLETVCNYVKTALCEKQVDEMFNNESPDRLIISLIMPKLSGVEICRDIKARYPNIEAILVSGSPDEIRTHLLDYLKVEGTDLSIPSQFIEDTKEDIVAVRNCWDVKNCGREPGGTNIVELGVCPASTETSLNGIHAGKNAGRACWVVAGSMCGGQIQGTYAEKYSDCMKCDFYMKVKSEENSKFMMTASLLQKLQVV